MRFPRRAAAAVCAGLMLTACGGSSSTDAGTTSASPKPLPRSGCSLLSRAEVSSFLGTAPTCEPVGQNTPQQDVVGARWRVTRGDQNVKVGLSRTSSVEAKETFEDEAGAKSNGGAKAVSGLGDDAVLVADPNSDTSGSIWILHGNDVIVVAVTHGNLTGFALARALMATGRRLAASY
jgi:hypothetical protein